MSNINLLPCPFCGGKAIVRDIVECFGHGDYARVFYVKCSKCFIEGQQFCERDTAEPEAAAIRAWNTRK